VHRSLDLLLPCLTTPQHGRSNRLSDDRPSSEAGGRTPDRCGSPCPGDRVVRYRGAISLIEVGLPGICVRRCILCIVYTEIEMQQFQAQHDIGQGERTNPRLSWGDERTCPVRDVPYSFVLPCFRKVGRRSNIVVLMSIII